jgi:hypothetical protein
MRDWVEPRSGVGSNELFSRLPAMRSPGQPLKRRKITCSLQCCGPGARAEGKGLRPTRIDKHIRALAGLLSTLINPSREAASA